MATDVRYSLGQRRLHWLMAALLVLIYTAIETHEFFPRGGALRAAMMQSHFWMGLTAFALIVWRLVLRRRHGAPPITPTLPRWQVLLATLLHVSLYAFFIVMPLLGLATVWIGGKHLYLPFTHIAVPTPFTVDRELGERLEDLHGEIGEIFYWIIGLHIVAGLYHHFIRRDDTLQRMT